MRSIRSSWLGRTRKSFVSRRAAGQKLTPLMLKGARGRVIGRIRQAMSAVFGPRKRFVSWRFVPDVRLIKGAEVQTFTSTRARCSRTTANFLACGVDPGLVRNSLMAGFALPGKIV